MAGVSAGAELSVNRGRACVTVLKLHRLVCRVGAALWRVILEIFGRQQKSFIDNNLSMFYEVGYEVFDIVSTIDDRGFLAFSSRLHVYLYCLFTLREQSAMLCSRLSLPCARIVLMTCPCRPDPLARTGSRR
jgi:hypothetical protein